MKIEYSLKNVGSDLNRDQLIKIFDAQIFAYAPQPVFAPGSIHVKKSLGQVRRKILKSLGQRLPTDLIEKENYFLNIVTMWSAQVFVDTTIVENCDKTTNEKKTLLAVGKPRQKLVRICLVPHVVTHCRHFAAEPTIALMLRERITHLYRIGILADIFSDNVKGMSSPTGAKIDRNEGDRNVITRQLRSGSEIDHQLL